MLCTVHKDVQQFITVLVHQNFTTCLQNNTTATKYHPPQISENIILRTNSLTYV
jgi:hypothetical protein